MPTQKQLQDATLDVLGGILKEVHENGIAQIDYFGVRSAESDFSLDDLRAAVCFHLTRQFGSPGYHSAAFESTEENVFQAFCEELVAQGTIKPVWTPNNGGRYKANLLPPPFHERWQFIARLSGGGQSKTYKVRDKASDRYGVLKLPELPNDSSANLVEKIQTVKERFRREVKILEAIDHPAIVKFLAYNIDESADRQLGYVTPFGKPLEVYWTEKSFGPKELYDQAYEIVSEIADGLAIVHDKQIIHRDLKPDNVIMQGEQPMLIDFGVATSPNYRNEGLTLLDGRQVGNHFNPPVVYGLESDDPRRDCAGLAWLYGFLLGEPIGGKRRPQRFHWQYHDMVDEPRRERARAVLAACSQKASIPTSTLEFKRCMEHYLLSGKKQPISGKVDKTDLAPAQQALAEATARDNLRRLEELERVEAEIKRLEGPLSALRGKLFEACENIRVGLPVQKTVRSPTLMTPMGSFYSIETLEASVPMATILRRAYERTTDDVHFFTCRCEVPGNPFRICASVVFSRNPVEGASQFRLQLWCRPDSASWCKISFSRLFPNGSFNDDSKSEAEIKEMTVEQIAAIASGWMGDPLHWSGGIPPSSAGETRSA